MSEATRTGEHTTPSGGRPGWLLPAVLAGGLAAVAGAVGVAGADGQQRRVAPVTVLHSAGATLELPPGWRVADSPAVAGLEDPLTARGPQGQRIAIGKADRTARNRTLLPKGLRTTARARRAGIALRYDDRSGSVFTIPTTEGVVVLTCSAPAATCSTIAATLKIAQGAALPLSPNRAFNADVARILEALERRERVLAPALERAGSRVWATKKLWWAYAGTAKALRQLEVHPADAQLRWRLAEAVRLAGCAYGRAAERGDRASYRREGTIVLAEQAKAAAALAGLGLQAPEGAASFTPLA